MGGENSPDMPGNRGAKRELPEAAKRALAEAQARRAKAREETRARELHGRDGPEPTRYGDWESNGILSDF